MYIDKLDYQILPSVIKWAKRMAKGSSQKKEVVNLEKIYKKGSYSNSGEQETVESWISFFEETASSSSLDDDKYN